MINTSYNIALSPDEGPTNLQVQVDGETGAIKLSVFSEQSGTAAKSVFTFNSDGDIQAIINTLKWARLKSLQAQGYKVVM